MELTECAGLHRSIRLVLLVAAALHRFAAISMGIFMATLAQSMPQFGMLSGADPAAAVVALGQLDPAREHAGTAEP